MENFRRELDPERYAAEANRQATAMRRDLDRAESYARRLRTELETARRELAQQLDEEQRCRHREILARRIDDLETAQLAADYAARHAEHAAVLRQKADALTAELHLLERDLQTMRQTLTELPPTTTPTPDDEDDTAFHHLEAEARERAAEARLEELKRKLR